MRLFSLELPAMSEDLSSDPLALRSILGTLHGAP